MVHHAATKTYSGPSQATTSRVGAAAVGIRQPGKEVLPTHNLAGEDFRLATSDDLQPAITGDFRLAIDSGSTRPARGRHQQPAGLQPCRTV